MGAQSARRETVEFLPNGSYTLWWSYAFIVSYVRYAGGRHEDALVTGFDLCEYTGESCG